MVQKDVLNVPLIYIMTLQKEHQIPVYPAVQPKELISMNTMNVKQNVTELQNITLMIQNNVKQNAAAVNMSLIMFVTQLAQAELLPMETNVNATPNITLSLLVEVKKLQLA